MLKPIINMQTDYLFIYFSYLGRQVQLRNEDNEKRFGENIKMLSAK